MSLFLSSASSILSPPALDWPLHGLQHQGRPKGKHVASTSPYIYVWLACRQVDYAKFSQQWKILFGFWNVQLHRTQLGMKRCSPCFPSEEGVNVVDGERLMDQMSAVQLRGQNSPTWALLSLGVRACPKFGEKAKSVPSGQLRQSQLLPFGKFSSSVC